MRLRRHDRRMISVVDSRTAPAVGDRDRRHAAQRIAAIGGAGGHDFPLSVPSPPPAGRRGSREPEPVDNALGRAAAGLAVGLAATPRPRRRPARPAAPQPPPPAPNVRPPRPGGQAPTFGVTGLAARPRSPSSGTTPHRPVAVAAVAVATVAMAAAAVRPQSVREAWSTGAEVAGAPWQTHRPPPSPSRLCVRLRLLHAGAGGSRPAGGLECRVLDPQPCAQHQQVQH